MTNFKKWLPYLWRILIEINFLFNLQISFLIYHIRIYTELCSFVEWWWSSSSAAQTGFLFSPYRFLLFVFFGCCLYCWCSSTTFIVYIYSRLMFNEWRSSEMRALKIAKEIFTQKLFLTKFEKINSIKICKQLISSPLLIRSFKFFI